METGSTWKAYRDEVDEIKPTKNRSAVISEAVNPAYLGRSYPW